MTSRHTKTFASVFLAGTILSGAAQAQGLFGSSPADDSFYVSGFVGATFPGDADFSGTQEPDAAIPAAVGGSVAGAEANVDLDFGTDIYYGGALGYQLPFQFYNTFHPRIEIEVSYSEADVDSGAFNDGIQTFSGDQTNLFIYANNFTDIRWTDNQVIVPYIGGGIGIAIVDTDVQYFPGTVAGSPPTFALEESSDIGLATHTTIGVSFAANDTFEIYTEGRYQNTYFVDAERRFVGGGADLFNADLDDTLDGFTLTAGVRYRF